MAWITDGLAQIGAGLLSLLAGRAAAAAATSLPLASFDMEAQHELAFRTLQGGLNTGKVVVRVAARAVGVAYGAHAVTGGTGGLGALTGRWLVQRGAGRLFLRSRSGALPLLVFGTTGAV